MRAGIKKTSNARVIYDKYITCIEFGGIKSRKRRIGTLLLEEAKISALEG